MNFATVWFHGRYREQFQLPIWYSGDGLLAATIDPDLNNPKVIYYYRRVRMNISGRKLLSNTNLRQAARDW